MMDVIPVSTTTEKRLKKKLKIKFYLRDFSYRN